MHGTQARVYDSSNTSGRGGHAEDGWTRWEFVGTFELWNLEWSGRRKHSDTAGKNRKGLIGDRPVAVGLWPWGYVERLKLDISVLHIVCLLHTLCTISWHTFVQSGW